MNGEDSQPVGRGVSKRVTSRGSGVGLDSQAARPVASAARIAAAATGSARRHNDGATAAARDAATGSNAPFSTSATSPMSRNPLFAILLRQRLMTVTIAGGSAAGNADQSGSRASTDASTSDTSSPAKARRPVSIS